MDSKDKYISQLESEKPLSEHLVMTNVGNKKQL